jgi:uncharacterized integral membrane protein (TIGR00697 family)
VFVGHLLVAGVLLVGVARLGRVWLVALLVVCTILMNIAVMKQMTVFGLAVTGGNVLFATVFLANDVINEHYGRRAARSAVVIGFVSGLVVMIMMQFVLLYRANQFDEAQAHLEYLFDTLAYPRIIVASMISYLLAQLLDAQLYHFIRQRTGPHRLLWLRSNASSWVSQAFDTAFFTTAGLVGTIIGSWQEWFDAVLFAYLIKIGLAACHTGFLYVTTWAPLRPPGSMRPSAPGG